MCFFDDDETDLKPRPKPVLPEFGSDEPNDRRDKIAIEKFKTTGRLAVECRSVDAFYARRKKYKRENPTAGDQESLRHCEAWLKQERDKMAAGTNQKNAWDVLLAAGEGKSASRIQNAEWVFNHLGVAPLKIDPETVPSAGAVNLLHSASLDDQIKRKVIEKMLPQATDHKKSDNNRDDSMDEILSSMDEQIAAMSDRANKGENS